MSCSDMIKTALIVLKCIVISSVIFGKIKEMVVSMLEKIYKKSQEWGLKSKMVYLYLLNSFQKYSVEYFRNTEIQFRVPIELLKQFGASKGTVIIHTAPFREVISLIWLHNKWRCIFWTSVASLLPRPPSPFVHLRGF